MSFAIGEAVPWTIPPDWGNPVRETLAWLTDYMSARNGARQKRRLRLAPRRSFEFTVASDSDQRRLIDALRFDQGARPWLLPIWPDGQLLTAQLGLAANTVACRTLGRDFVAGGQALLWRSINHWEVLSIQAVGLSSLTLAEPTQAIWPAGTRLYPLRSARLQSDVPKESRWNDDTSAVSVRMDIDEPCDMSPLAPAATYRGLPVLEWRSDEGSDPTNTYDRTIQTVDGKTGAIAYFDLPGMPFRLQSHNWLIYGRQQHADFRALLGWLSGRMGTLWVPSLSSDLLLASSAAAAATQLVMQWSGYTVFGRQQPNRRDLRIELKSGAVLYRRITASVENGSTETLTLDSAIGVAIAPANVRVISFMTVSEQAADSITIDHVTDADGMAQASSNWAGIRSDL